MQAYLLDDFKVEIDPRASEIGGCWQGKPRDGIPTVWGMDELRFFYERTLECEQPVVLDIGANTGAFSILTAMNPRMRSYAFEPTPLTYEILQKNISLNGLANCVKTFQIALSNRNGTVVLKYPKSGKDSGLACIGEPLRFDEWIEFEVETRRLDHFAVEHDIEKVDLIKIDTEGCELLVLRGAQELIRRCHPGIFCEYWEPNTKQFGYHPSKIVKFLTSLGYSYTKVGHEDMYLYHSERVSVTKPRIITSPSRAFELPGKPPHNQSVTKPLGFEVFDCQAAIEINKARQGHLASLGLELAHQSVLEVGSGVGWHTAFFEELGCRVLSTDARPENVAEHLRRYPYRKVEVADLSVPDSHKRFGEFDIIYCYGTLYHLSNPSLCIKELSSVCRKFFLIETCVSPVDNGEINPKNENRRNPNQSIEGIGCCPGRDWVMAELKKYFPFVYITTTQPDHHEFPLNWPAPVKGRANTRSVFVASRQPLNLPTLSTELPKTQKRLSAVPVSRIQQDNQEKFLDKTISQRATEKYTNRTLFREWISKSQETGQSGNITIFAMPKAFRGQDAVRQRNAIKSWTLLQPRPEIILFGDDDGVGEIAHEFGLRHIPDIKRNSYGAPLVNDLFEQAQAEASNDVLVYVNSDIILLSDFMPAVQTVTNRFNEFLMIEQRWDTDIPGPIDFEDADWERKLRQFVRQNASLHAATGIDCFVFTKYLWSVIRPFGLGRTMWDIWLVRKALQDNKDIIDATETVMIVHQNHPYISFPGRKEEELINYQLGDNNTSSGFVSDAGWKLTPKGLIKKDFQQTNDPGPEAIQLCQKAPGKLRQNEPSEALKILNEAQHKAQAEKLAIEGFQTTGAACLLKSGRLDEAVSATEAELSLQPGNKDGQKIPELTNGMRKKLEKPEPTKLNNYINRPSSQRITWEQVRQMPVIRLYAGDVPEQKEYESVIGLSLSRNDQNHLRHDITQPFPLMDNSVDTFQAEDVLEHIPYEKLAPAINEIYRVLKPGGLFRLSVPDYRCDVLQNRSIKDEKGQIVFDPGGGGTPENPGHVWFPKIDTVMQLLTKTKFHESGKIELLHYYNKDGTFVAKPIDYSKGHIMRTPDFDERVKNPYRPMSLVTDLTKSGEMLRETRNKGWHPEALVGMQGQSVVKTEPADPVEKCKQAHILMEQGHVLKALDRFDKILASSPDILDARLGRITCLARLGRLLEAEVEAGTLRSKYRHNQRLQQLYEHMRRLKQTLVGERDIEWDFVRRQLVEMTKAKGQGAKVLDFGCGHTARMTLFAAKLGYQVTAVDMVSLTVSIENFPNVRFVRADFLKHDWSGQSFDLIINCSSVEHAGLAGRYGVVESGPDDDLKIMAQMTRLLKPDGRMILTVPVGRDTVVGSLHRVYGQKRLSELLNGWEVESSCFWMKDENDKHRPTDEESSLQREPMLAYGLGCFVLQPVSITDELCETKDTYEPAGKKTINEPAASRLQKFQNIEKSDKCLKMQVIGTEYGGWAVDLDLIPFGSTVISAGIGEDISFDSGLINLKNCNVIGIDPTKKARKYVENNKNEHFCFLQKALYSESNKKIRIYKNTNPDYVSESITPSHKSVSEADFYEAETISVQDLLNKYKDVSVLKMDIEGAEYEVLNSISKLDIPQICVEFHHFCTDFTADDTEKCIKHLQRMGYILAHCTNEHGAVKEATLVHQKYISKKTAEVNIGEPRTHFTKDIPVILVCYNRPKHTLDVLNALREHNVQNLYVFSDAPKSDEDAEAVSLTRRLVHSIDWTKPEIIERTENLGLARNIVNAVDYVFERYDRLILLEDDCVPQRYFFDFMHTCLQKYENNPKVFGISGYTVKIPDEVLKSYPHDLYFCPRIGSWGWATWKRAWQHRAKDLFELIDTAVKNGIDLDQGGTDIPVALDNILKGNVKDVWTLHWVLSVYLNNGVYVYPTRSHILNVGMDGTGIHCKTTNKYNSPYCDKRPVNYPDEVFLDKDMMANFRTYYDVGPARRARDSLATRPRAGKAAMKICYINAGDMKGGAHRVGWMLKQGLYQRGFQTAMFVKNKISNNPDVSIITDAITDSNTSYKDKGFLYYDINSTFTLPAKEGFITSDIVHYHNLHGDYFNPFALPALTESKPSVWTLHDMQSMTGHCAYAFDCEKWQTGCGNCPHLEAYPAVTKDRTAEMWRDKKLIYEKSDFELIVPSQWLKNIVEKSILKDKRVHLIYNGIDERTYRPLDKHVIRKMFKIPPNAVVISFVAHGGLIDKRKGGDFILEAHKYFTAKYPNVVFICVGGISNKAPTERFLQIPFVLDEEKLVQLYCAADIFLFPTLADNCPLVILEVMGCGVPIVSFNTGGVPELIEHGKTGLIAEFKNSEEFIKMTEYLVADRTKREEFSAAGRERLLKMFTLEQMIDEHIALYERLAEEGRKKNYVPPKNKVTLPATSYDKQYKYLVSAIVSTYNSEKHIRGCLEDLENQTIADRLEIIVVNSGSQQNEEAIVRDFQSRYDNIKYIKTEERETIYKAWNRGIKTASGKYITNANTDDRHRQNALEIMARALDENPNKALAYADQLEVNEIDGRRVTVGKRINGEFSRSRLFDGECPPGSQPMWRKEVHNVFGYFDESFTVGGDYEFWFRLTQKSDFLYLNEILGERFLGTEVISQANDDLLNWEGEMVIHKCYEYALQEAITIGAAGISEHPVFSNWPEVNIWKQNTKAKFENKRMSLVDNIKDSWDFRTSLSPKLTIIIVTYNRHKELLENLYALNEQNEKDFEVIVMDNGGDLSRLKQHKDEFNFGLCGIELGFNFGPSPARNIGTDFAKAEYIAFLDDDAIADNDLVRNIVNHFENHRICGLRGKVLPKSQTDSENIPVNYDLGDQIIAAACEVSCLSAFRKDVFIKMGGFDELLFGSEGMELSYRICKAQKEKVKSILYFPDVVVYHDLRPKGPAQTEKTLRQDRAELLAHQKDNEITGYKELIHSLYPGNKAIFENNYNNYAWLTNVAIYLQKNFPEEAVKWAEKAVALSPDGIKGCYTLGSLYITLGKHNQGQALLERILEPLRNSAMNGSSEFISSEFEEQVDISDCYVSACTQLAQCYIQTNQYDKLKQVYTDLLNNPNLTMPEEQKAGILNVLTKLDKIPPAPVSTEKKNNIAASVKPEQDYLVSAIVSTYNSEKFLRGCLDDLENQTIAEKLEIIVVNSGSQENEEAIVREYQQKYNNIVYIKTEQREGIYTAWNRAVKVARGTFPTNANTDDRHRKDALEIMAKTLLENPDTALVYGDQICTDTPNGTFANHHAIEMAKRAEYSPERLLFGCCVGSQPMWRKSLHTELGYFDDTLTCAGDWDFWLRISSKYKFKHIPEFLGLYYRNENGIEHDRKIHSLYERYIVGKRYGNPYISVIPLYKSKDNPLVSVIMPAYNAAAYIAEAIESVLIQNYRNFELIVVDDGSTDDTKDIVASFKDDKIKYLYKDNGGPSGARNLAINKSKGQYIIPLDSDDMMTPKFISKHLVEFEKHPEADLVYCDDYLIDENGKPIRVIERPEYTERKLLIRNLFRCGFPVVPFRTCIRKSVFNKIGLFDEELLVGEDYDMMRRFVKHGLKIHHLNGALYLRRMSSNGLSRNFTAQKAKCHFDVIKRFLDTFAYDELFPDVAWDQIAPQIRQLHAKCLAAGTYLAIGQEYIKTNATEYSRTAFDRACSELNDCVKMDPENQHLRQLLQKSKLIRARYTEAPQQAVSK